MTLKAQNKLSQQPVVWLTATENISWSEKWSSGFNVQDRFFTASAQTYQLVLLANTYYKLSNTTKIGLGYIYFNFHRNGSGVPENRPYQSIHYGKQIGKWKINCRFNVEERFQYKTVNGELSNEYNFSFRFRLKFEAVYKLWQNDKENAMLLWLSTEPMLHTGKHIQHNAFDQNRLVVMVSYKPNNNLSFNAGYMNWLFQGPVNTTFDMRHVLIVGLSHKLSFEKKKEATCFPGMNCY